jgi:hypothetical protein
MSSAAIINNKFDGNNYRVSIVPVRKRMSIPDLMAEFYPEGSSPVWEGTDESVLKPRKFDAIFEAAVFKKGKIWKPFFVIEYGFTIDSMTESLKDLTEVILRKKINLVKDKITEEEFGKFVHNIIANEKLDLVMNGKSDVYIQYGFMATKNDMWQLFYLGKMIFVFIEKVAL